MDSPFDSENLKRIADALEALAAAQTHQLWNDQLKSLSAAKNESMMEVFVRDHPCPRCSKKKA